MEDKDTRDQELRLQTYREINKEFPNVKKIVCILEDDNSQLQQLKNLLEKNGHKAVGFSTISALREFLDQADVNQQPDIFLLGLALRDTMTGIQVAKILADKYQVKTNQVIFMTGWYQQFSQKYPQEFKEVPVIDKSTWTGEIVLEQISQAIAKL